MGVRLGFGKVLDECLEGGRLRARRLVARQDRLELLARRPLCLLLTGNRVNQQQGDDGRTAASFRHCGTPTPAGAAGRVTVTCVPCPGRDRSVIVPACSSIARLARPRPRPVPPLLVEK